MTFQIYKNKQTGEEVRIEKNSLFNRETWQWIDGFWIYGLERTDFLPEKHFYKLYEEVKNDKAK